MRDKPGILTGGGLWFSYWCVGGFSSLMVKVSRGVILRCGISTPFGKLCYLDAFLWLGIKIQILAVCFTKVTIGGNHFSQDWEINLEYSQVGFVVFLLVIRRLLHPDDEGTLWGSPGIWNKHPFWEALLPWCDPMVGNKNTNLSSLFHQGSYWRKSFFPRLRDKPGILTGGVCGFRTGDS